MKTEDLKSLHTSTSDFHYSVLHSLNKLEEKKTKGYKNLNRTMKIALVCAIITVIGAFTTVATATGLFGLFGKPVGEYGLNIKVEDSDKVGEETTSLDEKKQVKLNLGYVPEGCDKTSGNTVFQRYTYGNDVQGDRWEFTIWAEDAKGYDNTEGSVIDSYKTEYNGHQTIITTHKKTENSDEFFYKATEYFENWGYVVTCVCPYYNELIKIMENLDLEEYIEATDSYDDSVNDGSHYEHIGAMVRYDIEKTLWSGNYSFNEIGDSFECHVSSNDNSADLTVKLASVEERFDLDGLERENFNHDGGFYLCDRYFDNSGNLIKQYTETWYDGEDVTHNRHFYMVTLEVTANDTDIDNINDVLGVNANRYVNGTLEYYVKYGEAQEIYYSGFANDISIKKGETITLFSGIIVDDAVLDQTYITIGTADSSAYSNDQYYTHFFKLEQ